MKAPWTTFAITAALVAMPGRTQPVPAPITWAAAEAKLGLLFDQVDEDRDSRLSRQELFRARRIYRPAPEEGGMPGLDIRIWGHFDDDRDGYVSRKEAFARSRKMFEVADANGDRALSYAERQEAQENAFLGDRSSARNGAERERERPGVELFSASTMSGFRFNSGISEPRVEVVRDAQSWRRLWNTIAEGRGPAPLLPHIDFRRNMVLLAAMGGRGTGGYSIEIASVLPQGPDLVATVIRTSPGPRCGTTQAVTQPADLVKIARTSKRIRWHFKDRVTRCP